MAILFFSVYQKIRAQNNNHPADDFRQNRYILQYTQIKNKAKNHTDKRIYPQIRAFQESELKLIYDGPENRMRRNTKKN